MAQEGKDTGSRRHQISPALVAPSGLPPHVLLRAPLGLAAPGLPGNCRHRTIASPALHLRCPPDPRHTVSSLRHLSLHRCVDAQPGCAAATAAAAAAAAVDWYCDLTLFWRCARGFCCERNQSTAAGQHCPGQCYSRQSINLTVTFVILRFLCISYQKCLFSIFVLVSLVSFFVFFLLLILNQVHTLY